jgi:hypothetical protein
MTRSREQCLDDFKATELYCNMWNIVMQYPGSPSSDALRLVTELLFTQGWYSAEQEPGRTCSDTYRSFGHTISHSIMKGLIARDLWELTNWDDFLFLVYEAGWDQKLANLSPPSNP